MIIVIAVLGIQDFAVGGFVHHAALAVTAVVVAAGPLAVALQNSGGVGGLVFPGRAVGVAEAALHLGFGLHAAVQGIVGVLAHLRARDDGRQGRAHTGGAAARHCRVGGEDLALVIGLNLHAVGHDGVAFAHHGRHRAQGHADQGRNAHARGAAHGQRSRDGHQVVIVRGGHVHRARAVCLHVSAGTGFSAHLSDDDVDGAAHARRAAARNTGGVGGYELRGFGGYGHLAADLIVIRSQHGIFQDVGQGLALEVGNDRHSAHPRAAADAGGSRDVEQHIVALGGGGHVPARQNGSAQVGLGFALEHKHVCAARDAVGSARREGQGQQPHVVIRGGLHRYVAAGLDGAHRTRGHVLREDQGDDGSAHAGAAGNGERARAVVEARFVLGVHDHVRQGGLGHVLIISSDHGRAARVGLDLVAGYQGVDHARHRRAAQRAGSGERRQDDALITRRAHINAGRVARAPGVHGMLRGGPQNGSVAEGRFDGIADDRRRQGRAHSHAGQGNADAASGIHQGVSVIGFKGNAAACGRPESAAVGIFDVIFRHSHGDRAGYSYILRGAHSHGDQHRVILAQSLGSDALARRQLGIRGVHLHIALEHVHVHSGADAHTLERDCRGQDGVGHQAVRLGFQGKRAFHGGQLRAAADVHQGVGLGDQNTRRARDGVSAAGGGNRRDDGDELLPVVSVDLYIRSRQQFSARADNRLGLRPVDDHIHVAAHSRALGERHGGGRRYQQQILRRIRQHIQLAAGGDAGIGAQFGNGFVVGNDHVDGAAHSVLLTSRSRNAEHLRVGIHLRGLLVIAVGSDVRLAREAHLGIDRVVVDQQGHVRAHAVGSGSADRARDDAGIGAAVGVDAHAAVLALVRVLVLAAGDGDIRRAHSRVDLVVEVNHGDGTRYGSGTLRAGIDGAADGFGVIVGAGKEVQQVNRLEQILALDIDADLVAVAFLLHIEHAGFGILVRAGGIGHRVVDAVGQAVILHGDHGLFGQHVQTGAGDGSAVADGGIHHIVAHNHGHGSAHAHGSALGNADAARADGHFALVHGLHCDLVRLDAGVFADPGFGFGAADQHGNGPGHGSAAAAAADRACQRLRGQQAVVLAGGVLGQVGFHGHVAVFADDFSAVAHFGIGLVAVHAHRHARGDGVALGRQGHGRAGAQGAEVAFVARQHADAARRVDGTLHGGVHLMLADSQAHRRGYLYAALILVARHLKVLIGGAVGFASGLGNIVVGLGGIGLVADALGAHHVGGQGSLRAGLIGSRLIALGLIALRVQLLVDASGSLVAAFFFVGFFFLLIEDFAAEHAVGGFFGGFLHALELVGIPLHVRAHGGGHGVGFILVDAVARDVGRAVFQLGAAREAQVHVGINDIDGDRRAHRGGLAHGEAAGPGNGFADFVGGQHEVGLGRVVVRFFFALFAFFALFTFFGFFRFVDQDAVLAVGGDAGVPAHASLDAALQDIQGHGSVDGNILAAVAAAVARQRIGAGHGGGFYLALSLGADGQGVGVQHAVFAQDGAGVHFAVHEGEGRAHADGAALAVSVRIASFGFGIGVFISSLNTGYVPLGHVEHIGGLAVGGMILHDDLLGNGFAVRGEGIGQFVQFLAFRRTDADFHQILISGLHMAVFLLPALDADAQFALAGGVSDGIEGLFFFFFAAFILALGIVHIGGTRALVGVGAAVRVHGTGSGGGHLLVVDC